MGYLDGHRVVVVAHAHPDDETLATGALLAELVRDGVDVHVVTATRGERGELREGVAAPQPGTDLFPLHREQELADALVALGVTRLAFLGAPPARGTGLSPRVYRDSGMRWVSEGVAGPAEDVGDDALTSATVEEQTADLAAYVAAVGADLLISYDATGGYGHPDHVRMHEVTRAAAVATGIPMLEVIPPDRADRDDSAAADAVPGGVEWHDLSARLPVVQAALRRHASQVEVRGDEVVHVGGQREPIVTRVGLRPVG